MTGPEHVVLCAHGTRDVAGRRVVGRLIADVAAALPQAHVSLAFVDVQPPALDRLVARLEAGGVVVPLLLSRGYHVLHDVPAAMKAAPRARVSAPLGPSSRLADLQIRRLREAGAEAGDAVVVAVAGSSRDEGMADAEAQRALVAARWAGPVTLGYCSAREPRVGAAVEAARARDGKVGVSSYLLGPGFFQRVIDDAGADLVTAPLGAAREVVETVLERVNEAGYPGP